MLAQPKTFSDHDTKDPAETREGIKAFDARFDELLPENPKIVRHWSGAEWSEGAVYIPSLHVVVWSDIPNNRMLQFDPSSGETTVFREPSNFSNGNSLDLDGRMITAQHLTHGISRTELDGSVTMLVDRFEGKRFNSPNDLVTKSDGSIWFTDPPYGILTNREGELRDSELEGNFVYRFHPDTGALSIVIDNMDRPNGLAFSPDESMLYVADTGEPKNMVAFEVNPDGKTLSNKRDFLKLTPGASDGFRCDIQGNIWTSAADGIHCYTPQPELIGKILIPETRCANCCFGGPDSKTLYIAGDTSLYSVKLAIAGARPQR